MRNKAILLSMLVVVSLAGMVAAPAAGSQPEGEGEGEAYTGSHVSFDQRADAVSNYAVNGNVIVENVSVQSAGEAGGQTGTGLDLRAATDLSGAAVNARTNTHVSVRLGFQSGAEMEAHDNQRGVIRLRAGGEDQVVGAQIGDGAEAESVSDKRVVVTKDDGSQGTFIVVGDGEVVVNNEGNVTAEVGGDGELVYRQYDGERSDDDEEAERMIEEGTVTAEVYVQQAADEGEENADHAIEYGQDTTVSVTRESRSNVEMTVERAESDGKVVLTTVSEEAFDNADDIEVYVDGEAAAKADSFSDVETSATEGDKPRYYVAQSSSAEGAVDVAVGIDHFSERNVELTSEGGPDDGGDTPADDATDGGGAGFGALAALAALATALLAVRRR